MNNNLETRSYKTPEIPTLNSVKNTELPNMSPIRARIARLAIDHGLISDVNKILNKNENDELTKLSITGAHEEGHARGVRRIKAQLLKVQVFRDGSGVTMFKPEWYQSWLRDTHALRNNIRDLMYVGHMGKATEEALGITPHGHGFDMAQNASLAAMFHRLTGESGSSLNSEAENMARQHAREDIDNTLTQGIKHGLAA
jgi:hypothetical protein